jgi:hypothetical protein
MIKLDEKKEQELAYLIGEYFKIESKVKEGFERLNHLLRKMGLENLAQFIQSD